MDVQKVNSPLVSIVVPCYNHGKYVDDAIKSVEQITDRSLYELIIVNDGSKDEFTNTHLAELSKTYHVIQQHNQGLSATRNNGIKIAKGKYILPLDADNKIRPEYVYRGIEIMEANESISMVYGNTQLFGEQNGIRRSEPFNLQHLMLHNFIDACAIYRRTMWEAVGGYDTNMRDGYEDWEFWLHAAFKGFKFQHVDEILFDYRVLGNSMVHQLQSQKQKVHKIIEHLRTKHGYYYGPEYIDRDLMEKFSISPAGFVSKMILKKYFPKRFARMVENGKLRKYI
jgi:glycosyltransferase involved in cell wall biosynthesis